jgi:hypothetical protein
MFDDNKNFIGCTLCVNEDGKCDSKTQPADSRLDKILAALVAGIKINLNINFK